jgi:hypothetical protein
MGPSPGALRASEGLRFLSMTAEELKLTHDRNLPLDHFVIVIMTALQGRYRLGVRTEDSQSSNTGSIPVSATIQSRPQRNFAESPTKQKKLPVFCDSFYETPSRENAAE